MSEILIDLYANASLEQNRLMIKGFYGQAKKIQDLKSGIEMHGCGTFPRETDKDTSLETFLENMRGKNKVEAKLTSDDHDYPQSIEILVDEVLIIDKLGFRSLIFSCPWTNNNYEKISEIFKAVYKKNILDFPRVN